MTGPLTPGPPEQQGLEHEGQVRQEPGRPGPEDQRPGSRVPGVQVPGVQVPEAWSVAGAAGAQVAERWPGASAAWSAAARPVVWRDLAWRVREGGQRTPVLVLEPVLEEVPAGAAVEVPVRPGLLLGAVLVPEAEAGAGRWCSGFARAEPAPSSEPGTSARFTGVPCPDRRQIPRGQQCPSCEARDEFRPVHRVHRGGRLSPAAQAYVQRPHWLYVATFPDGTSKVGTAHERSKTRRLDQQAVAAATYVAWAEDGAVVRELEDAVTDVVGLVQAKRVSSKYAAWCRPLPGSDLSQLHADVVHQAQEYLRSLDDPLSTRPVRHVVVDERWVPALPMHRAYEALRAEDPAPLGPADLGAVPEGFWLSGAVGPFLTAHRGDPDAGVLLNAAVLKNRGVRLTEDDPVDRATQSSLF